MCTAPVWKDALYGPLHVALAQPPAAVQVYGTGSGKVTQVEVVGATVSLYDANQGAVPEEISSCGFTGMLLVVDSAGAVSPQIMAGLGHASLLLYSTVGPGHLCVSSSPTLVGGRSQG